MSSISASLSSAKPVAVSGGTFEAPARKPGKAGRLQEKKERKRAKKEKKLEKKLSKKRTGRNGGVADIHAKRKTFVPVSKLKKMDDDGVRAAIESSKAGDLRKYFRFAALNNRDGVIPEIHRKRYELIKAALIKKGKVKVKESGDDSTGAGSGSESAEKAVTPNKSALKRKRADSESGSGSGSGSGSDSSSSSSGSDSGSDSGDGGGASDGDTPALPLANNNTDANNSNNASDDDAPTEALKEMRKAQRKAVAERERLARTVWVGGVPVDSKPKSVRKYFARAGKIESVRFRSVQTAGTITSSKADAVKAGDVLEGGVKHAYVVYKKSNSIKAALALHNTKFFGHTLQVDRADGTLAGEPDKAIFLGNLPFDVTEDKIRELFAACGEIESARVIRRDGVGLGIGFINFVDAESVRAAVKLDGSIELDKRRIRVQVHNNSEPKPRKKKASNKAASGAERRLESKRTAAALQDLADNQKKGVKGGKKGVKKSKKEKKGRKGPGAKSSKRPPRKGGPGKRDKSKYEPKKKKQRRE